MTAIRIFSRSWVAAAALAALAPPALANTYIWDLGNLSQSEVPTTLYATDTLSIGYGNYKYVDRGLTTAAATTWLDTLYFEGGSTISNSGSWTAVGNGLFNDGGGGGSFVNSGVFDAGAYTVTVSDNIGFTNSGFINADAGGVVNLNSGLVTFNAGSQFTGAGVVSVNTAATFNGGFTAQSLQLNAGSGNLVGNGAQINGSLNWLTGVMTGSWQVDSGQALNLLPGNYKILEASLNNLGTVNALDSLWLGNAIQLTNQGLFNIQAAMNFNDNGGGGLFSNQGTLLNSSGGAATFESNIAFVNAAGAVIQADAGATLNFNGVSNTFNAGTQFSGAGQSIINNNATFNGAFTSQNLQLAVGVYTGNGAQINGSVSWITGTLAGSWQVDTGQLLTLQPGNYHYLNASLNNLATIAAQDNLYFENGSVLTNQSLYDMQGDLYLEGGSGSFVNNGILRKSGGTGTSYVQDIAFVNNGEINVQTGTLDFASGALTFNPGTQFTGAGQVVVSSNATFIGGFTTASNLTLTAGTFVGGDGTTGKSTSQAVMNGNVSWLTGVLDGAWLLPASQTLTLQPGNYHYLNASLNNLSTIAAQDSLYFENGNVLTNQSLYDMQGDVQLLDGGGSGSFINNGILRKSAGNGTSYVRSITFVNNGEINVQTGTLDFASGSLTFNPGTQFTGAGQVVVSSNATFIGGFTTASNLTLTSGSFVGGDGTTGNSTSQAVMNGNVGWVTGVLDGAWVLPAGQTLTLLPGNYHYLNASLDNLSTIAAQDSLYFETGNVLTNQSLYDMQGDVDLLEGGGSGSFVNNGILRKSAGVNTSYVQGITFVNNGEINVRTGTLDFASGSLNFNAGTAFTGAGQVVVTAGANFVGGFTTASNLTLSNGVFVGGDGSSGQPTSQAAMNGNVNWTTGTLAGAWVVSPGQTLTVQPGNYHYLNASLTNQGSIAAQDTLYFVGGNTLVNQGTYQLQGDVGFADGGGSGSFVNTGLVVKNAGTGTSPLTAITFSNAAGGVVDVQTAGTIALPNNFVNEGSLKGVGTYATNLLTNDGHVAPGSIGSAPGALALSGNFAQTENGSFDVGLSGVNFGSLTVSGTATLAGTIDAICVGSCDYAVGTTWIVMTSGGTMSGAFNVPVATTGFASGAFAVSYLNGDEVELTVTQATVAAVPEPSSWALYFAGLGALGFIVRRRKLRA